VKWLARADVAVVLYHQIAVTPDPLTNQLGVSTPPEVFESHLNYFSKNFDFISGDDLLSGILPRKPLLVTFDDAYRSVKDVAGPVLKSKGAPSVFFINAGTLTGDQLPIDNVLSFATEVLGFDKVLSIVGSSKTRVTTCADVIEKLVPQLHLTEVKETKARLCAAAGTTESELRRSSRLFLDDTDLRTLSHLGIEVGNHTMSHSFLRALTAAELRAEVADSRMVLERLAGTTVRHFSIPYGNKLDATDGALAAIRGSGHEAVYLVHAKSNRFAPTPDMFYRTSPGNMDVNALGLELGLLPLMRTVRDWVRRVQ
jgi:peptidoglycan/xylan/chitin deacetylase (PgdA/CDA1 family)